MSARLVFLLSCALYAAVLVASASFLPARVPLHFGGGGAPDRWGSRTEALVTMSLVGVGLALLLGLTALATGRMPLRWLNVPHKQWWSATPERERRLRRRMSGDLYGLAAATMLLLTAVVVLTVRAARLPEPQLDGWAWAVLGAYLVGVLGWVVHALTTRYRPEGP